MRYKFRCFLFLILFYCMFDKTILYAENKAEMNNGIITYSTTDTTASSQITWKTQGFTVKREKTYGNPSSEPKGIFMLYQGEKTSEFIGGITRTTFLFPEDKVRSEFYAAQVNAATLSKSGGCVYLNGIFQVYQSGKEVGGLHDSLDGIKHAMMWKNPNDFNDRFDILLKYETKPQPVYLTTMKYNNGTYDLIKRVKLTNQKAGTFFNTKTKDIGATIEYGASNDTFYLYRTHVSNLSDPVQNHGNGTYRKIRDLKKTYINPRLEFDSYKEDLKRLRNRSYSVMDGGIEIVCVYKSYSKRPPSKETEFLELDPNVSGKIQSMRRGAEEFDSREGIPSSNMQYVAVSAREYLVQYSYRKVVGSKTYQKKIWVDKTVVKEETTKEGEVIFREETVSVSEYIPVSRSYSYWVVEDLNVYQIKSAEIVNQTLPAGKRLLKPTASYQLPKIELKTYEDHLKEPTGGGESVEEIRVRNDRLIFGGTILMEDVWSETKTQDPKPVPLSKMTTEEVLLEENLLIDANRKNMEYESTGSICYSRVLHQGSEALGENAVFEVEGINEVTVHTPVICDGEIEDIRRFNQMIQPNRSIPGIVLDTWFFVKLPNTGFHSDKKGYQYRDYSLFTAESQVKFPFDVYDSNGLHKAFEWILIKGEERFYLPVWVKEGTYQVDFRSRAINCDNNGMAAKKEELANLDIDNYVAVDHSVVEVSGRVFGLNIYDISDYPLWKPVFRNTFDNSLTGLNYTVGLKDQNGNPSYLVNGKKRDSLFTLPIWNKSHPNIPETGAVKTGYAVRFNLKTIGNYDGREDYIQIRPKFYYIDKNGGGRKEVDLYYSETFETTNKKHSMVKVGSILDRENRHSLKRDDMYLSIPKKESMETNVSGENKKYVFTFGNIMLPDNMMTFIGINYGPTGFSYDLAIQEKRRRAVQSWYGEYYLPAKLYLCDKGTKVDEYSKKNGGINLKEGFWKKDGYILIQFDIETIQDNRRHLSYINQLNETDGYCNMWKKEGWISEKSVSKNRKVAFCEGDFVLYQINQSVRDDYRNGGIY